MQLPAVMTHDEGAAESCVYISGHIKKNILVLTRAQI